MRWAITVTCAALLAGCASAPEGGLVGTVSTMAYPNRLQEADDAKCRNMGFAAGTEAYSNCRLELERLRSEVKVRIR